MDDATIAFLLGSVIAGVVVKILRSDSPPKFSPDEKKLVQHLRGVLALKKWNSKEEGEIFLKENLQMFKTEIFNKEYNPKLERDSEYIARALRSVRLIK